LLEVAGLADVVEIEAAPGVLTIRPSAHPRAGWAQAAAAFKTVRRRLPEPVERASPNRDRLMKQLGVLDEDTLVKVLSVLQAMFAV